MLFMNLWLLPRLTQPSNEVKEVRRQQKWSLQRHSVMLSLCTSSPRLLLNSSSSSPPYCVSHFFKFNSCFLSNFSAVSSLPVFLSTLPCMSCFVRHKQHLQQLLLSYLQQHQHVEFQQHHNLYYNLRLQRFLCIVSRIAIFSCNIDLL